MNILEIGDNEEPTLVLWVVKGNTVTPLVYTPIESTKPCGFTAEV